MSVLTNKLEKHKGALFFAALFAAYLAVSFIFAGINALGDDRAYLEAVFAKRLAANGTFSIYGSQIYNGVASPLFEFLLYPAAALAPDYLPLTIQALSALLTAAACLLTLSTLKKVKTASRQYPYAAALALALTPASAASGASGGSFALGLFLSSLCLYILYKDDRESDVFKWGSLSFALAALCLARPEGFLLCALIPFLPREGTGLKPYRPLYASALGFALAVIIRLAVLGSVFDGVREAAIGRRGLLYALSAGEINGLELLRGATVYPAGSIVELFGIYAFAPAFAAGLAALAFFYRKSEFSRGALALLFLPGAVYGAAAAEVGAGAFGRNLLATAPFVLYFGYRGLCIATANRVSKTAAFKGALASAAFFAAIIVWKLAKPNGYWSDAYDSAVTYGLAAAGGSILFASLFSFFASGRKIFAHAALSLSLIVSAGFALQAAKGIYESRIERMEVEKLFSKMELVAPADAQIASSRPGVSLWLRKRPPFDLTGAVYYNAALSKMQNQRRELEASVSQLNRVVADGAQFVACVPSLDCKGMQRNNDFTFVMRDGKFELYKATPAFKNDILKRYGPPGTALDEWDAKRKLKEMEK